MDWYDLLPSDLRQSAYKSQGGELAWSRPDALRVISILECSGHKIRGVDTWIPTNPGPTPYIYDWAESRVDKLGSATEFVQKFNWSKSDADRIRLEPYFNISADRIE
jgi:hypothetical protein